MTRKRGRDREIEGEERRGRKQHSFPLVKSRRQNESRAVIFLPHCDLHILCTYFPTPLLRSTGSLQGIASYVIFTAPYSKLESSRVE
jgi:hypothetical protein